MYHISKDQILEYKMSFFKLDKTGQSPSIETIEEKYDLDKQIGGYMLLAKSLVGETAGTVGLNLANAQVKVFLTQYIPSIIINVTNIYGVKVGSALLSKIQMTLINPTGAINLESILSIVINTVGLGSAAMLGLSEDEVAFKGIYSLLRDPMMDYAKTIGYSVHLPQSIPSFTGNIGTAGSIIGQAASVYQQAQEVYLTPFKLLSGWLAEHTVQLAIDETRDPYIKNTLKPAFEKCVDDLLPKRDLESNFDPLNTQNEHAYDVAKKTASFWIAQYQEFKENSNILIYFILEMSEELVVNPHIQNAVVGKIAGPKGREVLDGARKTYDYAQQAYAFASDENALSKTIADWMQENFEKLAEKASNADFHTVKEHAELFKKAFSGNVLTKDELDTIKGKWEITKAFDAVISSGYNYIKDKMVRASREKFTDEINEVKSVLESRDLKRLDQLLNSADSNVQFTIRYIILKSKHLTFKSQERSLPLSPLMFAIETGSIKLVKLLVENGQIQDTKNKGKGIPDIDLDQYSSGVTPLQFALMNGNDQIAKYLIDKGADLLKPSIIGKATPLMIAAKNGNANLVEYLIHNLQEVDSKGFRDRTALHYAMRNRHMECAAQLITKGANLFLPDANGFTPIGLFYKQLEKEASEGKLTKAEFEQTFEQCLQTLRPAIEKKIHKLVSDNKAYPLVRDYLRLAINIGCKFSPIAEKSWFDMLFQQGEYKLIFKLMNDPHNSELINEEMRCAVTDEHNKAVLILEEALSTIKASEIASRLIKLTYIEVINDCLSKVRLPETKNNTFTFLRFESLNQSVLNSIIERDDFYKLDTNVLIDIFNHQIKNGQVDSVKLILKKVPKLLDHQDGLLNTPLHYSLQFGRYEITQFLLTQGADIQLKNKNGDTAYENWSQGNTLLNRLIERFKGSNSDVLAKGFAFNLMEINKQIDTLTNELTSIPAKESSKKIYDTLTNLIGQDSNDEVRNDVIFKILQRSDCDLEVFNINKGNANSLILKVLLRKDYKLLDEIFRALLAKYPHEREDNCQFFMNELLAAPILESDIIKGMDVILKLPDNENNTLLLLSDEKLRLPSEIAFQNKKYSVMEYILKLAPQNVSLQMMDYILSNNLPCAEMVFDKNQRLIADLIMDEEVSETVRYLKAIWLRPQNDFNLRLFKTYFLNASGEAINQFLKEQTTGYIHSSLISIQQLVSQFNDDELALFVDNQFKFLSDNRKLEFLELVITQGNMKLVRSIVGANPDLLNLQLPALGNRTPLHMAINNKNWQMTNYFMAKGCLVNLKNNANSTAYDDWFEVSTSTWRNSNNNWDHSHIEQILKTGSDSEIENAHRRSNGTIKIITLFHAQEIANQVKSVSSKEDKITIIAERIQMILIAPNQNLLKAMTMDDYLQATRDLITDLTTEHQITLNDIFSCKLPSMKGNTLLHEAISAKNKIATDFMLKYPAQVDSQNDDGNTPLHLAIKNDDPDITERLIKLGALVDVANSTNSTALDLIESAGKQKTHSYSFYKPANLIGKRADEFIALTAEIKLESGSIAAKTVLSSQL
jgi:ankyrin repeat protein